MATLDCTLVTCEQVPALDDDDRLLADELRSRGLAVAIGVWSDPLVDWAASRLCLLRSTWDYHRRYDEFLAWVRRASAVTTMRNEPSLVCWNSHKSYLLDLQRLGVPIVPTAWFRRGEACDLARLRDARGWRDLVLKPALGAAAHGVSHVREDAASLAAGQMRFDELVRTNDVLVQPYLRAVVGYGERALIFLRGSYSHAIVKTPFDTVLTVSETKPVPAHSDEVAVATRAIESVPGDPLYARVDLLRDDAGSVCVSELELIEPGLYFGAHAPARRDFADGIERALGTTVAAANPRARLDTTSCSSLDC